MKERNRITCREEEMKGEGVKVREDEKDEGKKEGKGRKKEARKKVSQFYV
jgi:hypothetical protein